MFGYAATAQAIHASDRHLQLDMLIEQIALPYMADTPIMDQRAWFKTATAARQLGSERLESQREGVFDVLVCLATANLPEFLTVNPLFPAIMRRT